MLTINWDDYPEVYDDLDKIKKLKIEPKISSDFLSQPQNLLIEGDNYPLLNKLCEKLKNSVDIIYIDPPYNTGNNFTYNDSFAIKSDLHSCWLSFMSRRLKLARELLSQSACIFIAIDQSELYVLKLLCDQIFGQENFVNDFMWLHGKGKKDKWSRTLQQHTLCYAKNKAKLAEFCEYEYSSWAKTNPDNDPRGNWFSGSVSFSENRSNPKHPNYYTITSPSGKKWTRQWQRSKEEMDDLIKDNRIYWGQTPSYSSVPRVKIFNGTPTQVIPRNIIDCVESTRSAQNHLDQLLEVKGLFDNPKPVDLISHLIEITQMKKDALIMDFFAGSGTTFEAVSKLNSVDGGNRHCILIQKAEEIKKPSGEENPSNGFNTIFDICKARCLKVAQTYKNQIEILKLTE
ncbi:MAG: site-specific DNA-methyltransferase [Treponema sp.]|nr:site-specific DNA-methyltransferase [Treponema sp.]